MIHSFKRYYSLDYRSLALFRISLGLILLLSLIQHFLSMYSSFSYLQLFDQETVLKLQEPWNFSFHHLSRDNWYFVLISILHFLVLIAFIFGFYTRFATALTWIFFVSLNSQIQIMSSAGDTLVPTLLLISVFLPLNRVYAWDSRGKPFYHDAYFSLWSFTLFFQIGVIYIMSFLFKIHETWSESFYALSYILNSDFYSSALGSYISTATESLRVMTQVVRWWELLGGILLLIGFVFGKKAQLLKSVVILLFFLLHLSMAIFLEISSFPYLFMSMLVMIIPSWFWAKVKVPSIDTEPSHFKQFPALIVLILIFIMNVGSFPSHQNVGQTAAYRFGQYLQLSQKWSLFSIPLQSFFWIVLKGKKNDGEQISILSEETNLESDRDAFLEIASNVRWKKFFLVSLKDSRLHPILSGYACKRWDLAEIEIHRYFKKIVFEKGPAVPINHSILYSQRCSK